MTLVPYNPQAGVDPSWLVQSVGSDFQQPTPEPSTLLLVGTCALAPMLRRIGRSHV